MEIGSGLGFEVQITLTTYNFLKEKSDALVYTYLHIKKDGQTFSGYDIFGFSEYEDKILFVQLLDVSGIGANTARLMLNALSYSEIRRAIISEDERTLSGIKGIGPKTAKRLILELKDKMLKGSDADVPILKAENKIKEDLDAANKFKEIDDIETVFNTIQTDRTDTQIWKWFVILALLFLALEVLIQKFVK